MQDPDTICVISSALGEAGIGIIRMSGPRAHSILKTIFRPKRPVEFFTSHHLYLGLIIDPQTQEHVDEVFAVFMEKPSTYTREAMAEVYAHGGISPQRQILSLMVECGARIAEPGEFTKRAFLNGRIDLAQAESVLDIIQSESDEEAKSALRHLRGVLSQKIGNTKEQVRQALANTEAAIDFPEEELDVDVRDTARLLENTSSALRELISSYTVGRAVKKGVEVLIVGRANVGKSSLFNALLMEEKAIVTPLAGTTRDLIEDTLHVRGIKLRITDTAGLRRPRDVAEEEGVRRVNKKIPEADVILWLLDNSESYLDEDEKIYENIRRTNTKGTIVAAVNKCDLPQRLERDRLNSKNLTPLDVCALTGAGLDDLKESLYERAVSKEGKSSAVLITNVRHHDLLMKADEAIQRALLCIRDEEFPEFTAFELRDALTHLGEITGETCTDDILNDIFNRFCIGK
jgi:tRNA modification GTPase